MSVLVDIKNASPFMPEGALNAMEDRLNRAHDMLLSKNGEGSDFTGWVELPENYDREEFARIKLAAARIVSDSEVLLVIGIGGSYLGARAALELMHSPFYNQLPKNTPEIYFVGNNLSPVYINEIIALIEDRDFSINVISKSGTTTEPAVAFRIFKELIEKKYGVEGAKTRIYATTDKERGALKGLADQNGYECFVIPDDVGGRYSVLTPVGLLPIACAGIDIDGLMDGAKEMRRLLLIKGMGNPAWQYAAVRNALYEAGKTTEVLACYLPSFRFMAEWWKQLFGESEGKDHKGIFPASLELTADLHSMGQYVQEGHRNLIETVVDFSASENDIIIKASEDNADGLNFLSGASLHYINQQAAAGTMLAHVDGGVPNIRIIVDKICERSVGELIYFFEFACGLSGYLLGVNPFNQPGVEAYKQNMFALLSKPGYESEGDALRKRLL